MGRFDEDDDVDPLDFDYTPEDDLDVDLDPDEIGDGIHSPLPDGTYFADASGRSALRAATARNPRNLPCPSCGEPNRLTPADVARGYQCDVCADADERGF